ncbi:MAG: PilN domain-containing protein [Pseudomonadota bacterium]
MVRINLLPWRETQQARRHRQFLRLLLVALLATSLILATLYGYNAYSLAAYAEQNHDLENHLNELVTPLQTANQLTQQQTDLVAYKDLVYQWQISQAQSIRLFDELVNTLPVTLTLDRMTQQDEQITLEGHASSARDISTYIRQLATSPWLRDPQLDITAPDAQSNTYRFHITARHVFVPALSSTP